MPDHAPQAEANLRQSGLTLPSAPRPAGHYSATRLVDGWLYTSGALPWNAGEILYPGQLGRAVSVDQGRAAARAAALNLLAMVRDACDGDLDRVSACVRLTCTLACTADFHDHPRVIDPASDLICTILGTETGRHARLALAAPALPFGAPIQIEGVFRLRPA
ncbi:RidA family protein [Tabrizicola fusiformis]|uniref:RidA family protein n=1 Tax=Tabrizicola sp. SY72 TaxID=2741673 RepID=UPI001574D8D2|nr:RidA family protein [Tabrizicola sp. SY72]NTT86077.1 RidA family protein [Tabrizicola sp. SY72]